MKFLKMSSALLFFLVGSIVYAQDVDKVGEQFWEEESYIDQADQRDIVRKCCHVESCCPDNSLKLCRLCVDAATAKCFQAKRITAKEICATNISTQQLCAPIFQTNSLCSVEAEIGHMCAHHINVNEVCALKALIRQICAEEVNAQNVCVSGIFRNCGFFNARAATSSDYTYNLGDDLIFDQILSDPSGSIQEGPTAFIAPETGTYIVTAQVVTMGLNGPSIIIGTPVGALEVYVNGILRRQAFGPYLTFASDLNLFNTSLVYLVKGQSVIFSYKVLVVDPVIGLMDYPGTVTIKGSPTFSLRSFFSIAYISSDCTVEGCDTCDLQCPTTPCEVNCTPCVPAACMPCCGLNSNK